MNEPKFANNLPGESHLDYLLRESALGIRAMYENRGTFHAFNYGADPQTGKEFVLMMLVLPAETAHSLTKQMKKG